MKIKKTIRILSAALLIALTAAQGSRLEASSLFKVGVKGGINFNSISNFDVGYISESMRNYTAFNAGVAFSFQLPVTGLSIQPELNYTSKGALLRAPGNNVLLRTDYIELPVNFQAGLDLILFRPFIMVSPYIGYAVNKEPDSMDWDNLKRFEYGVGIGGGVDVWRFQLQVKYNWNIGTLVQDVHSEAFLNSVRKGKYRGLEVNIVFFF